MERTPEYYLTKGLDMVVNGVAAVIFLCCLAYAGYALWDNWSILDGSENALKTMVEYKPDEEEGLSYNFSQLMAMNPDVCGWIVMDHTGIDYPIVQGEDNFEYLDKDALGNPEISGSIFLDWQNNRIHIWYLWGIICRQEKCSVIWINIVMKHFSRKIQLGKFICRTGCYTWKQLRFLQ